MTYWAAVFFFFSSRRRHTRSDRDWSSDVCSSDLLGLVDPARQPAFAVGLADVAPQDRAHLRERGGSGDDERFAGLVDIEPPRGDPRSEERRVGKERRSRWSPYH